MRSTHLRQRLENDLFSSSSKGLKAGSFVQSPRVKQRLNTEKNAGVWDSVDFSVVSDQLEVGEVNKKQSATQRDNLMKSGQLKMTDLEMEGQPGHLTSTATANPSQTKSPGTEVLESFDSENLAGVLGKDRYQRLMKNFEESEWISTVDSARQEKLNIFLSDEETDVTLNNNQRADDNDENLGLRTHRPSEAPSIILNNSLTNSWQDCNAPVPSTSQQSVKCAFSVNEIYAKANEVGAQGFVFKHLDSDSDSSDTGDRNRSDVKYDATATNVFCNMKYSMPFSSDEAALQRSFVGRATKLDNRLHKSLDGREVTPSRHKPFGPVPQLRKKSDQPLYRQVQETGIGAGKQDQSQRKSGHSDEHMEGVRQHVEKK